MGAVGPTGEFPRSRTFSFACDARCAPMSAPDRTHPAIIRQPISQQHHVARPFHARYLLARPTIR